jgi:Fungal chitosanase of glycosyl hydrolase group 75
MMNRRAVLFLVIGLMVASMSYAGARESCQAWGGFDDPHPVMFEPRSRALFWVRPLEVDADGARNAYHRDDPHGSKGLAIEYVGNGMSISRDGEALTFNEKEEQNTEWLKAYWMIVNNGWKAPRGWDVDIYGFARDKNGKVCVRPDGKLISSTSLVQHPQAGHCNPKRYVDALRIPGIVVPNRSESEQPAHKGDHSVAPPFARRGVSRGDLAVVYNPETRIWRGAIIYDTGPRDLLGEGSLRLALDLRADHRIPKSGVETNALGISETNVVVFPGTAKRLGSGITWSNEKIHELASHLFTEWGGGTETQALDKLLACATEYRSRYR